MGTSTYQTSILGKAGTETIRGFATISATNLQGTTVTTTTVHGTGAVKAGTSVTATTFVRAGSYIRLGGKTQYMFAGSYDTEASIVAVATNVAASPGSLYMSVKGTLWIMDAATTATRIQKF